MNNKKYAVINKESNIVENVILWDGRTEVLEIKVPEVIIDDNGQEIQTGNIIVIESIQPWMPPINNYVICIEGTEVGIGWLYNNGEFIEVINVID